MNAVHRWGKFLAQQSVCIFCMCVSSLCPSGVVMMYAQMSRFCSEGESTQSVLPKYDCNTRQPNGARSVSVVVGFFLFRSLLLFSWLLLLLLLLMLDTFLRISRHVTKTVNVIWDMLPRENVKCSRWVWLVYVIRIHPQSACCQLLSYAILLHNIFVCTNRTQIKWAERMDVTCTFYS